MGHWRLGWHADDKDVLCIIPLPLIIIQKAATFSSSQLVMGFFKFADQVETAESAFLLGGVFSRCECLCRAMIEPVLRC